MFLHKSIQQKIRKMRGMNSAYSPATPPHLDTVIDILYPSADHFPVNDSNRHMLPSTVILPPATSRAPVPLAANDALATSTAISAKRARPQGEDGRDSCSSNDVGVDAVVNTCCPNCAHEFTVRVRASVANRANIDHN